MVRRVERSVTQGAPHIKSKSGIRDPGLPVAVIRSFRDCRHVFVVESKPGEPFTIQSYYSCALGL